MNEFKKNPNYLLMYCLKTLAVFLVLDVLIYANKGFTFAFELSTLDYFLPLLAIFFCGLPSSILHNCAHGNIGPKRINNIIGEICGTIMLYGFKGFALGHMFHHIYPDDPDYDVHPPRGFTFLSFVVSPVEATIRVIEKVYYENFGTTAASKLNISLQKITFNACILLRVVFWGLVLGPKFFMLFYVPVYIANIFIFAHINYATHIEREDGPSEIINLNHNLYYKFANLVSLGGYFHKSHHLKPQRINPSKVIINDSKAFITYIPKSQVIISPRGSLFLWFKSAN